MHAREIGLRGFAARARNRIDERQRHVSHGHRTGAPDLAGHLDALTAVRDDAHVDLRIAHVLREKAHDFRARRLDRQTGEFYAAQRREENCPVGTDTVSGLI